MKSHSSLSANNPWAAVALSIVLYVLVFAPVRAVVGDVVGALSSIPILIAGSRLSRRKVWGVALTMILVNGAMFAVTEQTRPTEEWVGAVLGSVALLITADLMGRVRDNELRVKRSGESKDRFLAGVSHELRTPLTAVVGYSSILKASWPGLVIGERQELLEVLHRQAVDVANIVEDLLVATRLDIDEVTIAGAVVSPAREIEAVVRSLSIDADRQLAVQVPRELVVVADAGRFRQIMRNLLSNAFRYGGPQVAIEASASATAVSILVKDNGPGLSRDEWESVFESYYRSHQTDSQPDSVGLGLSVSRRLAHRMGGGLSYRYLNGESRFELTLPAVEVEVPKRLAAMGSASAL